MPLIQIQWQRIVEVQSTCGSDQSSLSTDGKGNFWGFSRQFPTQAQGLGDAIQIKFRFEPGIRLRRKEIAVLSQSPGQFGDPCILAKFGGIALPFSLDR